MKHTRLIQQFNSAVALSQETMAIVARTKNQILSDLHAYYRAQGYQEAGITMKVANLLLLMPKLEVSPKGPPSKQQHPNHYSSPTQSPLSFCSPPQPSTLSRTELNPAQWCIEQGRTA